MSHKITPEGLDKLADIFFEKPNKKLDMTASCECIAGYLGKWAYENMKRSAWLVSQPNCDKITLTFYEGMGVISDTLGYPKIKTNYDIPTETFDRYALFQREIEITQDLISLGIGHEMFQEIDHVDHSTTICDTTAGFWTGNKDQEEIDSHEVGRILRVGAVKLRAIEKAKNATEIKNKEMVT